MDYCVEFGQRLRETRINAKLSQRELAESAEISPQMISAYEKSERKPSIEAAAALAVKLGVSLDYLCGIEQTEKESKEIHNVADAVQYIEKLANYFTCDCSVEKRTLPESEWEIETFTDAMTGEEYGEEIHDSYDVAVIRIDDQFISDFFNRWIEIKALYNKLVISKEIMDSWYSGELERLRNISITETKKPKKWFCIEPYQQAIEKHGKHKED